jgi:hypothetical protein
MNLEKISRKYNVSENFLQSKDDGLSIGVKSIDDLIIEIKKGNVAPEKLIYQLSRLRNFMFDVKNSTI